MAAEIAREIGDFARAQMLLAADFPPALREIAGQIRVLVSQSDHTVAELPRRDF